jgi:hypothetical protein
METLYLPYLTEEDSLATALKRLKKTGSRAVVVAHNSGAYRLYRSKELVSGVKSGKQFCREFTDAQGIPVVTLKGTMANSSQWMTRAAYASGLEDVLRTIFEEHLDFQQVGYGLLYPPQQLQKRNLVLVVTRHEGFAYDILNAPKSCLCEGPMHHSIEDPPDHNGKPCEQCESTYKCY